MLGGNRGLANPLLQACNGFVVAFFDFLPDDRKVRVVGGGERVAGESERCGAGGSSLQESASVHGGEDNRGCLRVSSVGFG